MASIFIMLPVTPATLIIVLDWGRCCCPFVQHFSRLMFLDHRFDVTLYAFYRVYFIP
jgi:hypothetical protein